MWSEVSYTYLGHEMFLLKPEKVKRRKWQEKQQ